MGIVWMSSIVIFHTRKHLPKSELPARPHPRTRRIEESRPFRCLHSLGRRQLVNDGTASLPPKPRSPASQAKKIINNSLRWRRSSHANPRDVPRANIGRWYIALPGPHSHPIPGPRSQSADFSLQVVGGCCVILLVLPWCRKHLLAAPVLTLPRGSNAVPFGSYINTIPEQNMCHNQQGATSEALGGCSALDKALNLPRIDCQTFAVGLWEPEEPYMAATCTVAPHLSQAGTNESTRCWRGPLASPKTGEAGAKADPSGLSLGLEKTLTNPSGALLASLPPPCLSLPLCLCIRRAQKPSRARASFVWITRSFLGNHREKVQVKAAKIKA